MPNAALAAGVLFFVTGVLPDAVPGDCIDCSPQAAVISSSAAPNNNDKFRFARQECQHAMIKPSSYFIFNVPSISCSREYGFCADNSWKGRQQEDLCGPSG